MKFGKILQQSIQLSKTEWETQWLDYKRLKGIVKECVSISPDEKLTAEILKKAKPEKVDIQTIETSVDEKNFFRTLRVEIKKVADFFVREQQQYRQGVQDIIASFNQFQTKPDHIQKTALMASCTELYKELLLLENFAVINYCAVSKILKKHDKWTGYATRRKFLSQIASKVPFVTYEPLLMMINRLEKVFMDVTGMTIDQHEPTVKDNVQGKSPANSRGRLNTEDQVTLFRIHALRDDTWQVKKTEEMDTTPSENDTKEEEYLSLQKTPPDENEEMTRNSVDKVPNDEEEESVNLKRKDPPSSEVSQASSKMKFSTILN